MTGKPPRLGEVMRWLTAKEDISPAEREADPGQLSGIRRLARTRMLCSMVGASGASPA